MKNPDPASLQNLNDIVMPANVGWWPLAAGWYVLSAIMLVLLAWYGFRSLRSWIDNRYRRAALRELQALAEDIHSGQNPDSSLRQLPGLLKRTALSAYPRKKVASLSGADWQRFLNSTLPAPAFSDSTAATLDLISYSTGGLGSIEAERVTALVSASRTWLQHHSPGAGPRSRKT